MSGAAHHGWDAVRSQIMARLSRCELPSQDDAGERPIFFAAETPEPYYGPTPEARAAVNRMFALEASAGQLEWRAELRKSGRIDEVVRTLSEAALDLETRSALALLLLDAIDRMAAYGPVRTELLASIRWELHNDPEVRSRMRYFWTHMEGCGAVMEAIG